MADLSKDELELFEKLNVNIKRVMEGELAAWDCPLDGWLGDEGEAPTHMVEAYVMVMSSELYVKVCAALKGDYTRTGSDES